MRIEVEIMVLEPVPVQEQEDRKSTDLPPPTDARRFRLPSWKLVAIGAFLVGASAFFANVSTVFDNARKESVPTPLPAVASSPSPDVQAAQPAAIEARPQVTRTAAPRERRAATATPVVVREVPAGVRAGDYSVVVSNSAYANTHTTYNFNSTVAVPAQ